ncbi:M15 family metallopeptidase [Lihuaxuella thermophila]|uniref:LD-carboxypeptidase LdcB, LAS superfamily n=1 Tax=Lihuaxuella thermophila TaxID=1173111 RepID=A0A1H8F5M3_9BACL|nr:M15 family metallopeptidase [Lihuaxuella thermophila]SEN26896.1 LD-carboxypeptidase LdcB, LAS superfamily [Lihuaxuella thermophila]
MVEHATKQMAKRVTAAILGIVVLLSGCSGSLLASKQVKQQKQPSQKELQRKVPLEEEVILAPGDTYPLPISSFAPDEKKVKPDQAQMTIHISDPRIVSMDQNGRLQVSKNAKTGDTAVITSRYRGMKAMLKLKVIVPLEDTVVHQRNGQAVVTNATDTTVVVNKNRNLPAHYVPRDLVQPNVPFSFQGKDEKKYLRKAAADALEQMFQAAKRENIQLYAVSGYRSYARQKMLYNHNSKVKGTEHTSHYNARPGQSEHQTGLAIDISSKSVRFSLIPTFGQTKEGKWLQQHAAEFGFILRYPQGKEKITGYAYEPWHFRYVGKEMAREITEKGITLEEYFAAVRR